MKDPGKTAPVWKQVLYHLQYFGSISSTRIEDQYRVMNAPKIIWYLRRKKGYPHIHTEFVTKKRKDNGESYTMAIYWWKKPEEKPGVDTTECSS